MVAQFFAFDLQCFFLAAAADAADRDRSEPRHRGRKQFLALLQAHDDHAAPARHGAHFGNVEGEQPASAG